MAEIDWFFQDVKNVTSPPEGLRDEGPEQDVKSITSPPEGFGMKVPNRM